MHINNKHLIQVKQFLDPPIIKRSNLVSNSCQYHFFSQNLFRNVFMECGKPKFEAWLRRACVMIGKPALQNKPKKRTTRKRKHPFISNHHMYFIWLISWGVYSQSALPLKSYRGRYTQPYLELQMHWQYFFTSRVSHNQCTVLVPHFKSMCLGSLVYSCVIVELHNNNNKKKILVNFLTLKLLCEALFTISSSRLYIVLTAACACSFDTVLAHQWHTGELHSSQVNS